MPACKPWAIVKVPFPYTDRPVLQRRPALVLACMAEAGGPKLLWVAMITSAAHRHWSGDLDIADLTGAGLPAPSMVRLAKIATIEAAVAEPLGQLAVAERASVRSWLGESLGPLMLDGPA